MIPHKFTLFTLVFALFLAGCTQAVPPPGSPALSATSTAPEPISYTLTIGTSVPDALRDQLTLPSAITLAKQADGTALNLDVVASQPAPNQAVSWYYALVAPFPTSIDGIELQDLKDLWIGDPNAALENTRILASPSTLAGFGQLWGNPDAQTVISTDAADMLETAWNTPNTWAIIPFDELQPRWKVLHVNGTSPLDKPLDTQNYPLIITFGVSCTDSKNCAGIPQFLPQSNRLEDRMAIVILTGTTALVRHTALRMEEKGITYPGEQIKQLLRSADLLHVSNEISFSPDCPPGKPLRGGMTFCSSPTYIQLFEDIGVDLVELTGNHLRDYGGDPLLYTFDLYDRYQLPYYGGGRNIEEANRAQKFDINGNHLAFLGCNVAGPENIYAAKDRPGAAPCDFPLLEKEIGQLVKDGYLVVFTFQHFEAEDLHPRMGQRDDFKRIAEAGALIVSGSQSHFAQGMTFTNQSFIHYGLGNLFFDQMEKCLRPAYIYRHIFYNKQYISTELVTT
ncbi:MAG: CapA family protein, partial [Anaerolineaceae bacterium]|nr:CapA family protein [Anaerolineaceae bacterium]